MKKILFILSFFSLSSSYSQFEFKVDLTKEKLQHGYESYAIGNTLYYFGISDILAINLDDGSIELKNWENFGGKFLNHENLKKNRYLTTQSAVVSKNGNVQFILQITQSNKNLVFVRLEIDKNLNLIDEAVLLTLESSNYLSDKKFETNPATGESVFIEHNKNLKEPDVLRSVFFNNQMELVSNKDFQIDIQYKNLYNLAEFHLNSLFVISEEYALINFNEVIYCVSKDECKPLKIELERKLKIKDYIVGIVKNNGFVVIGFNSENDEENLVVMDFDKNLNQISSEIISLPNSVLATCKKQMTGDFSQRSYGYLDLVAVFTEPGGTIRLFGRTIPPNKDRAGYMFSENLFMITIDEHRKLIKTATVPTESFKFSAYLNTGKSIKVVFEDSPKNYDNNGVYIENSNKVSIQGGGNLAVLEFNKESGELISRKLLEFSNDSRNIKGTLVYPTDVDSEPHAIILNIYRDDRNDLLIGKLK